MLPGPSEASSVLEASDHRPHAHLEASSLETSMKVDICSLAPPRGKLEINWRGTQVEAWVGEQGGCLNRGQAVHRRSMEAKGQEVVRKERGHYLSFACLFPKSYQGHVGPQ